MKKERFRSLACTVLILIQEGKVLLMKRANTGFGDGLYALPGGGIDGNEPLKSALCREAYEELGITVVPDDLEFSSVLHTGPYERNKYECIIFCFKVKKFSGTLLNAEPDKCDELRFFPLDELPENMLDASRACLHNMTNKIPFEELYW